MLQPTRMGAVSMEAPSPLTRLTPPGRGTGTGRLDSLRPQARRSTRIARPGHRHHRRAPAQRWEAGTAENLRTSCSVLCPSPPCLHAKAMRQCRLHISPGSPAVGVGACATSTQGNQRCAVIAACGRNRGVPLLEVARTEKNPGAARPVTRSRSCWRGEFPVQALARFVPL